MSEILTSIKVNPTLSLSLQYVDRANPVEKHVMVLSEKYGISAAPMTPQMFASAGREHMEKYGRWCLKLT